MLLKPKGPVTTPDSIVMRVETKKGRALKMSLKDGDRWKQRRVERG